MNSSHDPKWLAGVFGLLSCMASQADAKSLIDYFVPTPIVGTLTKNAWGAGQVGARDQSNGLEDRTMASYSYWDGRIIQATDGMYHMFCSRWDQSKGHWSGWPVSVSVHATSSNLLGPYTDKGLAYTDQGGKGHNVTGFTFNDGTYGLLISQTRPTTIYTSKSLDGPWTLKGTVRQNYTRSQLPVDPECYANSYILPLKDGNFLEVDRHGFMFKTTNKDVLNTTIASTVSSYPNNTGFPDMQATQPYAEDPVMWFSGGRYHMVVNWPVSRVALHLMSDDGINNWKNMGLAFDPRKDFIRYTDGTINKWNKLERPGIVMGKDGHVVAFTFAAMNVDKGNDLGNDKNGSKIIVVPFDGATFDKDFGIPSSGVREMGASASNGRSSLVRRGGTYALEYSGLPGGEAELFLHHADGALVARRNAALGKGGGAIAWNEVGALPGGLYFLKVRSQGRVFDGDAFFKL